MLASLHPEATIGTLPRIRVAGPLFQRPGVILGNDHDQVSHRYCPRHLRRSGLRRASGRGCRCCHRDVVQCGQCSRSGRTGFALFGVSAAPSRPPGRRSAEHHHGEQQCGQSTSSHVDAAAATQTGGSLGLAAQQVHRVPVASRAPGLVRPAEGLHLRRPQQAPGSLQGPGVIAEAFLQKGTFHETYLTILALPWPPAAFAQTPTPPASPAATAARSPPPARSPWATATPALNSARCPGPCRATSGAQGNNVAEQNVPDTRSSPPRSTARPPTTTTPTTRARRWAARSGGLLGGSTTP